LIMDLQQEIDYISKVWNQTPKVATIKIRKENRELYEKIQKITGSTFSEKCRLFVSSQSQRPKCHCGNDLKYLDFSRGYTQFCSTKCTANSPVTNSKKSETCLKNYGVEHYSKTPDYKEKFKSTMMARHGVTNPGQIEEKKYVRARQKQYTFFQTLFELEHSTPNFSFHEYTHVRDKNLNWICKKCASEFQSCVFSKIPLCPVCFPAGNFGGQSSIEKQVVAFIRSIYSGEIIENSRDIISPKEIDIYLPEFRLAIEVNGIYWHSDKRLARTYHNEKYKLCESKAISLLMITDYEWNTKRSVVEKMIKHRIMRTPVKIHGRTSRVEAISADMARKFLENNHINGFVGSTHHLGLFSGTELHAVMSISEKSRFEKNTAEITRLASSSVVHGAVGKFLSYIRKNLIIDTMVSYADLRYGSGNVYLNNGFSYVKDTNPGYWYHLNNTVYHRLSWSKAKLVKLGYDSNKTEFEIMDEIGALRIYDAGHKKYILRFNHD
jgi:hypothetical protein